jgi:hypothetical protein
LFVSAPDPYLTELADMAMGLAREADRRARKTASDSDFAQLTLTFERLARSVRLCRMLDQRLQDERSRARRDDHARLLDRRSKQLKSAVGLAIDAQHGLVQATRLRRELSERLEHDRLFGILAQGSVEQHIVRLGEHLGLQLGEADRLPPCPEADGEAGPPAEPPDPLTPTKAGPEPRPAPDHPASPPTQPP